jgi:hypothetical protein
MSAVNVLNARMLCSTQQGLALALNLLLALALALALLLLKMSCPRAPCFCSPARIYLRTPRSRDTHVTAVDIAEARHQASTLTAL